MRNCTSWQTQPPKGKRIAPISLQGEPKSTGLISRYFLMPVGANRQLSETRQELLDDWFSAGAVRTCSGAVIGRGSFMIVAVRDLKTLQTNAGR
jgi:hypothetical protein